MRSHNPPFAHFKHRRAPPAVIWVGEPWYGGYDDSTCVAPDERSPPYNNPTAEPGMAPPRLGCRAQTYRVRSEAGGDRFVKMVRC
jgi:hypothetical protein